jgi:ribonuclease HI
MTKIFYSDGACSGNPGPGGWGLVFALDYTSYDAENDIKKTIPIVMEAHCGQEENTTNNRMEMMAVLKCMELAAADQANNYICYSDSAYVVNMCNDWIRKWAKNGWQNSKKQTVENLDLVKKIYNYLNTDFFNFQLVKCAGHSGILGNELADALATKDKAKWNRLKMEYNFVDNSNIF